MVKVLVVEDEASIREMIALNLRLAGMEAVEADSAEAALPLLEQRPGCDAAILDVMLPGMNGFSLCETIRRTDQKIGIIILSAKGQEQDKIRGLSIGADDYMTKPFLPKELLLRLSAILRRSYKNEKTVIELAHCTIDFDKAEINRQGETFPLTAREHAILNVLYKSANRIVTMDALCAEAWGDNLYGYENSLMAHIRRIREKIEMTPSSPESLITIKGLGYKLIL